MLTHPLGKHKVQPLIKDIRIDKETSLKHVETITQAYKDTPYFDRYKLVLDYSKIFDDLSHLNYHVIDHICKLLDINTEIAMCSPTDAQERLLGSDLILAICRKENASTYLSGPHGSYLNLDDFKKANIEVKFQDFKSNNLSVLDSLFRIGAKETRRLL